MSGPCAPRSWPRANNPHGLDVSVPRLGFTASVTALGGPGGRDGVFGVGLALAPPALAIGPVHLDHRRPLGLEMTGQSGPIGSGALDADQLDGTEVARQANSFL